VADDFQVTGQQQFIRLAKALNAQGKQGRGLWKELNNAIKESVDPMVELVKQHLGEYLPDNYAKVLAPKLSVRVSRSTRGTGPALKLVGTAKGRGKRRRVKTIDQGTLRHPVFTTDVWVDQSVRPGFWRDEMESARGIPAKKIRRAVQRTLSKLD
jgi:hypothetical protein